MSVALPGLGLAVPPLPRTRWSGPPSRTPGTGCRATGPLSSWCGGRGAAGGCAAGPADDRRAVFPGRQPGGRIRRASHDSSGRMWHQESVNWTQDLNLCLWGQNIHRNAILEFILFLIFEFILFLIFEFILFLIFEFILFLIFEFILVLIFEFSLVLIFEFI